MVTTAPPTVIVPVRVVRVLLRAMANPTMPFPFPEAPEVIVIQPTPDLAVHGHVADTLTDAGPPALPAVMAVAETAGVHGAGDGGGGVLPPAEPLWTNCPTVGELAGGDDEPLLLRVLVAMRGWKLPLTPASW